MLVPAVDSEFANIIPTWMDSPSLQRDDQKLSRLDAPADPRIDSAHDSNYGVRLTQ